MSTDIRSSEFHDPIDVATYLFTRLKQIGVESVHGVPGDYNVGLQCFPGSHIRFRPTRSRLTGLFAVGGSRLLTRLWSKLGWQLQ